MALARLSLVKGELLTMESAKDAELTLAIQAASNFAERFTGRALILATYTDEFYSGKDSRELWLQQYPVNAITNVKVWDGSAYTALDSDHYALRADERVENRYIQYPVLAYESAAVYGWFPRGQEENISVTYSAGYADTNWDTDGVGFDVPAALEYAVAKLAALMWFDGKGGDARLGQASRSMGGGSQGFYNRYEKKLPADVSDTLLRLKRRVF